MIAAPTIASPFAATGEHWLLDCHGVAPSLLTASATLEALLVEAAVAAGARVLFSHFHRFGHDADSDGPEAGVTGVVLLAESHLTIHTWPEHGFAAIDLFLCGATKPERAVACLARGLGDPTIVERRQRRGLTDASPSPASRDR